MIDYNLFCQGSIYDEEDKKLAKNKFEKRELAMKKFGYICTDYVERENLKYIAYKEPEKYAELILFSRWSRSLEANKFDLRHPEYTEYRDAFLTGNKEWLPKGSSYVNMEKYLKEK